MIIRNLFRNAFILYKMAVVYSKKNFRQVLRLFLKLIVGLIDLRLKLIYGKGWNTERCCKSDFSEAIFSVFNQLQYIQICIL